MVRLSLMLARTPVIKFRKGGVGPRPSASAASAPSTTASAPAAPAATATAASANPQLQPATAMSTSAIPDIDLPLRYRRAALTQEEIDHINGGGIV